VTLLIILQLYEMRLPFTRLKPIKNFQGWALD
jgi:hypothetical protein